MPEPEHRRTTVNKLVRLLPEEAETLHRAAERLGMSDTQLLRLMCRQAMFLTVSVVPALDMLEAALGPTRREAETQIDDLPGVSPLITLAAEQAEASKKIEKKIIQAFGIPKELLPQQIDRGDAPEAAAKREG